MIVSELIEELKKYQQDKDVVFPKDALVEDESWKIMEVTDEPDFVVIWAE